MNLTVATVGKGLSLMAKFLKNSPVVSKELIMDWHMIFSRDCADKMFQLLSSEACLRLTFFPTPGEFRALIDINEEERCELAWQYAKRAYRRHGPLGITLEDVGYDQHTIWAVSAVGIRKFECLGHAVQPENHENNTRMAFRRAYKTALRYQMGMERVQCELTLPRSSPAMSYFLELEASESSSVPRSIGSSIESEDPY